MGVCCFKGPAANGNRVGPEPQQARTRGGADAVSGAVKTPLERVSVSVSGNGSGDGNGGGGGQPVRAKAAFVAASEPSKSAPRGSAPETAGTGVCQQDTSIAVAKSAQPTDASAGTAAATVAAAETDAIAAALPAKRLIFLPPPLSPMSVSQRSGAGRTVTVVEVQTQTYSRPAKSAADPPADTLAAPGAVPADEQQLPKGSEAPPPASPSRSALLSKHRRYLTEAQPADSDGNGAGDGECPAPGDAQQDDEADSDVELDACDADPMTVSAATFAAESAGGDGAGDGVGIDADLSAYHIMGSLLMRPTLAILRLRHCVTGEHVALKVLHKARSRAIDGEVALGRMENERRISRLLRHPFVVSLQFDIETDEHLMLGMELIRGPTLAQLLAAQGKLSKSLARLYAAELLLALNYMHENSVAYRDLNPENIMIDANGHIKLVDLGDAVKLHKHQKKRTTPIGPAGLRAPEMLMGRPYGFAADWWNFGVIVFMMLANRSPFQRMLSFGGLDAYARKGSRGVNFPAFFPPDARDLIDKLLQRNPKHRLGGGSRWGAKEIQLHPFFSKIDWLHLEVKAYKPKYVPQIEPFPVDEMPEFQDVSHAMEKLPPAVTT